MEKDLIPRTLHYCWYGKGEMPPLIKACMESWKRHMPGWKYVLWNEDNLPDELVFAKKLLEKKMYAFVSDYMRLYAIWKEGGIYLDTDIEVLRPLDSLLDNRQFMGFERQGRATSGVCGGVAGAPFFRICIEEMDRHYARSNSPLLSPEFCTRMIETYSFPDLKIYPPHVFYPYNPHDNTRPVPQLMVADIKPDTLAVHHWAKSWRLSFFTRVRRMLGRIPLRLRRRKKRVEFDFQPETQAKSLRKKMAEGAGWALLEKLGAQGTSFVVFTIIARLVGPEEYGLVSLCYIYLALACTLFSSMVDGVVNLRIRDDFRLSSLFWGVAASGLVLSGACFAAAGPFAAVMEQPRLASLLRWFSLLPFLFALSSVPTILVTTSMNFRVFTIRTVVATTIGGIVGIVLAFKGFGAYAIVAQQIVLYAVINLVIWPGCGWRPRFMFGLKEFGSILKPGLKMSGSLFVTFFEQQIPRLLIGHFLGPVAVGHFAFVTRMRQSLQEVLVYPLSSVSYPAFAHILENAGEQKKILSQLIALSGTLVFPCVTGAIVTAPIYVPLLFGETWNSAVPVLQIFLATGASLPLLTMLRDFLRAHNLMGPYLKLQTFMTAGGLLATLLLVPHGLVLAMQGIVGFSLLSIPAFVYLVARKTKIRLWRDCLRLWAPIAASVLMALTLYIFDNSALSPTPLWKHLLADIVVGSLAYGVASFAFQFRQVFSLIKFLKSYGFPRLSERELEMAEADIGNRL